MPLGDGHGEKKFLTEELEAAIKHGVLGVGDA